MMQGILIVDKPTDWTSFDVIAKLRGIWAPGNWATAVRWTPWRPVFCRCSAAGPARAVDLQLDHTKAYRAVLRLGQRTDTGDVTGTVLETAPVTAGEQELLAVLPQFLGPRMQTPPMYSAVKINGQPLYKLAREGKTVERKARPIEILDIRYEGSPAENEYALTVKCSKGTYIRVLLEEIAEAMGQKGHHERPAPRGRRGVFRSRCPHAGRDPGGKGRGAGGPAGPDAAGGERVCQPAAAGGR